MPAKARHVSARVAGVDEFLSIARGRLLRPPSYLSPSPWRAEGYLAREKRATKPPDTVISARFEALRSIA